MFAEELSGNASRKRQEEARARRRQIKQKQQQQQQRTKSSVPSSLLPVTNGTAATLFSTTERSTAAAGAVDAFSSVASVAATAATKPTPLSEPPSVGGGGVSLPGCAAASATAMPLTSISAPTTTNVGASASSSSSSSAVAQALEQRRIRNQQRLRVTSATRIQSFLRSVQSNTKLKQDERAIFDRRMADLVTLGTILEQTKGTKYIPPPATASSLTMQILFVTGLIPRTRSIKEEELLSNGGGSPIKDSKKTLRMEREDFVRLNKLLRHVLLPGLHSSDDHLDPIMPWLSTAEGRMRLKRLLRLCLHCLAESTTSLAGAADAVTSADAFLRVMIGCTATSSSCTAGLENARKKARHHLVRYSRPILLPVTPATARMASPSGGNSSKNIACGAASVKPTPSSCSAPLDLIQILRALLIYNTGGKDPIPHSAEKLRERCISPKERDRADVLFRLALDAVDCSSAGAERSRLQSRFVSEIFTVPLLTWRVSPLSISKIISIADDVPPGVRTGMEPILTTYLASFAEQHAAALSTGNIGSVLPSEDVPLTVCPAPNVLCLLANLVQMGRLCTSINASDVTKLNYEAGALFFNVVTTLIDLGPLGTFTSRLSAVEWVTHGKSHHTPIVLSNVVIDQCKILLVDSYVRGLFQCAINDEALNTASVIRTKNEKDLKHEKDMIAVGTTSAASLAAKEAMIDRNKSFWQSSKWARKLSKTVTSLLSGENSSSSQSKQTDIPTGGGTLMNTSSISRMLAHGGETHDRKVSNLELSNSQTGTSNSMARPSVFPYSVEFLFALCRTYGSILSRWGGLGKDDIVRRFNGSIGAKDAPEKGGGQATAQQEPCVVSLLNVICFATGIVRTLWAVIQSDSRIITDLYSVIDVGKSEKPIRALKITPAYSHILTAKQENKDEKLGAVLLFVFLSCLSHILIVTDDCEIFDMDKPLPQHQFRRCILLLKKLLYRACCVDDVHSKGDDERSSHRCESNHFGLSLIASSSRTMRDLYDRSSRRPLCVPKLWLVEDLLEKDIRRCRTHDDYTSLLRSPVLRVCPFLVSFKRRLKIFERIVTTDRINIQGSNEQQNLRPGVVVHITRGRVLEDGLLHLNSLGSNLRRRIVVQYLNQAGAKETGVDVGGLFKEFWSDLSNMAFDPNFALFRVTEGSGLCLYPNPSSRLAHGSDHIILFEFLGRILGKALYEGITIQPRFAHFFLSFLRGDYNFLHMLPDLSTIDSQLYNNLMFLKTYEGDAADLCLTFTIANNDFGGNEEVSLIPNGADVEVTNSNKHRYIGLVAKHHVYDRLREQSEAFTRGLWEVIDRSWLRLFNEPELQVLISGATDGKIDVADMKANTRYTGGYTGLDKHVHRFWNVVSSLNSKQQGDLLRFVTSCERPPPLGFASMNPPFTIQRVWIMRDGDKLPSASTCFNTLKLPTYSSERVLRERLVYAIEAGAGFELT